MIFPNDTEDLNENIIKSINQNDLHVFSEYAINFDTNQLLYDEQNKNIIVTKDEALKIWIWKVLQTAKNRYKIYGDLYGNDTEKLIGKGYSKALIDTELKRYIEESLLANPYILSVNKIDANFNHSKLNLMLNVKTLYNSNKEVNISV